ncbi:MAG TPA: glycine cleavage T C-terminal barrel domain-containing protein [Acidimicrobiales bacterium]|nr:glycine cleavage T C-terminal barrel domain-containing protein [Acidimicrobiales bacterium]
MEASPDYEAMRRDVGAFELPRDFLRVAGPDAVPWMQGQLSQDVAALPVGAAADSLLLQPQGKVDALLRVLRLGPEELVLDVDEGFGEAALARLRRFKIRVKADVDPLGWHCLALRGPRAPDVAPFATGGVLVAADWPGLPGVDVVGEAPALSEPAVRRCSLDTWQTLRIEAGIPAMGAELTERTIPAEAGIVARTVSFTKGCYTGQELVARIDSRGGNVPRHLRGIVVDGATPPVGAAVMVGDKEVGTLTSVAPAPGGAGVVALAYVRREVEPPAEAEVRWEDAAAAARVEILPLVH